jgi:hypothetical protein
MDSRQVIARFEVERQALALMDHPNIAKVLDAGTTDTGRPYFAMELVKGTPITRYCDEHRLTPQQRLELFVPVCQAVQHAHQKGIIHRDLKPSNVLVCQYDGRPVPKIIDFGVAKAAGPKLTERTLFTELGQVVGTLEYMSPEQAQLNQLDVDTRSDIYSLGVLLYELLTATTPLERPRLKEAALLEVLRLIREEEPPKPSTRLSTADGLPSIAANRSVEPKSLTRFLRGELDWIVMKCLEKDRNRRYETANAFAADLLHHLHGQPVLACPPSATYRIRKFARRNKIVLATVAIVTVALLAGTGAAIWQAVQATQAEAAAQAEADAKERARISESVQRQRAQTSEAETNAVLDFVVNKIVAAARPGGQEGGQGYDVKLADAVKAALPFVDQSFTDQPLIEARLRSTIGDSLYYLRDGKSAVEQFEKAHKLYATHRGPDHEDTLQCLIDLAGSYQIAGRPQEAVRRQEETLPLLKAKLGLDHPKTLRGIANLAVYYAGVGRNAESLALHEEAFALLKAKHGPTHADTLMEMNNLAQAYIAAGHHQDGLKLHEETLGLERANLGSDHPETLRSMNNLAEAYRLVGRMQDALKLHEETLQLKKGKLGPDHADTLTSMSNLAYSYTEAGHAQEALKLREELLRMRKAKLGLDHRDTLISLEDLANSYLVAGRTNEAIVLREEGLPLLKAKLGPDHPDTLWSIHNLADSYARAGRMLDALALREANLPLRKAKLGPDHPDTLLSMNHLANSYIAVGEADKAMLLLQEALTPRERRVKTEAGSIVARVYLSWTYAQMGDVGEVRLDFAAAADGYARAVEILEELDRAGKLSRPSYRDALATCRRNLTRSRKAPQAVRDLDFALKQPTAEVPELLELRLRFLLKEGNLAAAVAAAAKMKDLAGEKADPLYGAACAYSLCAAANQAKSPAPDALLSEKLADVAVKLLKQAAAKGYKNAARMRQARELDALRERADFKALLEELETAKKK